MEQKNILCFGDSNTWGAPPDGGARYDRATRWPALLQRQLGDAYYVIEEGLPGRTTVWDDPISGSKNGLEQIVPLVLSHMPLDLLIIFLGTNDLKRRFNVSAVEIARSVGRLTKVALDASRLPAAKPLEVLVLCPPQIVNLNDRTFLDVWGGAAEKSRQLASELAVFCKDNAIHFLDTGTIVQSSPRDGVHWEAEEHQKLAIVVCGKINEIL